MRKEKPKTGILTDTSNNIMREDFEEEDKSDVEMFEQFLVEFSELEDPDLDTLTNVMYNIVKIMWTYESFMENEVFIGTNAPGHFVAIVSDNELSQETRLLGFLALSQILDEMTSNEDETREEFVMQIPMPSAYDILMNMDPTDPNYHQIVKFMCNVTSISATTRDYLIGDIPLVNILKRICDMSDFSMNETLSRSFKWMVQWMMHLSYEALDEESSKMVISAATYLLHQVRNNDRLKLRYGSIEAEWIMKTLYYVTWESRDKGLFILDTDFLDFLDLYLTEGNAKVRKYVFRILNIIIELSSADLTMCCPVLVELVRSCESETDFQMKQVKSCIELMRLMIEKDPVYLREFMNARMFEHVKTFLEHQGFEAKTLGVMFVKFLCDIDVEFPGMVGISNELVKRMIVVEIPWELNDDMELNHTLLYIAEVLFNMVKDEKWMVQLKLQWDEGNGMEFLESIMENPDMEEDHERTSVLIDMVRQFDEEANAIIDEHGVL